MSTAQPFVLGIDIGDTIRNNKARCPFPDAYRVVRRFVEHLGIANVWLVSRVNDEQEKRTRAFINGAEFQEATGLSIERVRFCRERHEKGAICSSLGIERFIDDRPAVMAGLPETVTHRILFRPREEDLKEWADQISGIIVSEWKQIETLWLPLP